MRVVPVTRSELSAFVSLPDLLYRADTNYVPYLRGDLRKTLKKLLFRDGTYRALLVLDDTDTPVGRVLFTVGTDKHLNSDRCGFFSMYECIDDPAAAQLLFSEMERQLKDMGAEALSGPFFPHDPDNRRGFLLEGFHRAPLIFTSYNPPYYNDQMAAFGMEKQIDAVELEMEAHPAAQERLASLAAIAQKRFGFRVEPVDLSRPEREIHDIARIFSESTTEINHQDAPSVEMIEQVFRGWKRFLAPDFILIARRNADDSPIGFVMAIPDYFELFRKMKGRLDPRGLFLLLTGRKKIRSLRAMLQYTVPAYQNRGVTAALYHALLEATERHGIDYIEAGTIMENNPASILPLKSAGGKDCRVYRIWCKHLKED